MNSVFAKYAAKNYPFRYAGTLQVDALAGGIPTDPQKVKGWLQSKIEAKDDTLRKMVAETMVEMGVTADEATDHVAKKNNLNGFKRDDHGLYIEGRQLKAALKEAANVAANEGRITAKGWGNPDNASYKKGLKAWFPEHVFVVEDRLHLGVVEPTRVNQRFVHTFNGSGIQYEEIVEDAKVSFTIETDHEFTDAQWAAIWLTGERNGIGASRSVGFGCYTVVAWERLT